MRRCASRKKSRESISSAAWLNASLWIRIAPSTDFSASRLCGSARSGVAGASSFWHGAGERRIRSRTIRRRMRSRGSDVEFARVREFRELAVRGLTEEQRIASGAVGRTVLRSSRRTALRSAAYRTANRKPRTANYFCSATTRTLTCAITSRWIFTGTVVLAERLERIGQRDLPLVDLEALGLAAPARCRPR